MMFQSTKLLPLGSCAFRQPRATSHCRFIHGYRLQAKFWFSCSKLDSNGWCIDFGNLKHLKELLEKQFDHTTVIALNDPELETFKLLNEKGVIDLRVMEGVGIERFAEYCWKVANDYVKSVSQERCWCSKVEVFEHEQNSAIYENTQL